MTRSYHLLRRQSLERSTKVYIHNFPHPQEQFCNLKEGAIAGTVFHRSDSGWVNAELFLTWLQFFAQSIPPLRPIYFLFLMAIPHHMSIEAIEFARSNDIHMLCLPAHTTHILQPLDVGVFKSFKSFYHKEVQEANS